jgi:hypothetical protein
MPSALVIVVLVRVLASLPVLRWPLAGGLLALVADLLDLLALGLLGWAGVSDYQALDKWLDQVYLATFLIVALRWSGPERSIAVALYVLRLVGFAAFAATGERTVLVLFPNVFELWFLAIALRHRVRPGVPLGWLEAAALLALATAVKLTQEWALHVARLFDGVTFLDALEALWATLTCPFC